MDLILDNISVVYDQVLHESGGPMKAVPNPRNQGIKNSYITKATIYPNYQKLIRRAKTKKRAMSF